MRYQNISLVNRYLSEYTEGMKTPNFTLQQFNEKYHDDDACLEAIFKARYVKQSFTEYKNGNATAVHSAAIKYIPLHIPSFINRIHRYDYGSMRYFCSQLLKTTYQQKSFKGNSALHINVHGGLPIK